MGSVPVQSGVNHVVVDPANPKRVYAAGPDGVVRSDDSGQTWQVSGDGLDGVEVIALAIDPAAPETLYAAAADGDLFVSDDGATAWRHVDD